MSTETLATPIEAAVTLLRQRVAEAESEMESNPYWEGATFAEGIDNACGGGAGRLAAMFSPEVADMVADLLEEIERQQNQSPCDAPGGACNGCSWRPDFVAADVLATLIAAPQEVSVRG